MTVVEGNRRLAALRILAYPELQAQFRANVPDPLHENAIPTEIQVNYVGSRKEARDFIGFKHVNGAFKWDSYAKARFAYSWLQDGDDIDEVGRRLGDRNPSHRPTVHSFAACSRGFTVKTTSLL